MVLAVERKPTIPHAQVCLDERSFQPFLLEARMMQVSPMIVETRCPPRFADRLGGVAGLLWRVLDMNRGKISTNRKLAKLVWGQDQITDSVATAIRQSMRRL